MDDVVGLKVHHPTRGWIGVMTWGRLWDPVDDADLLRVISKHSGCAAEDVQLCWSLRDLSDAEYFYEAIIWFSWKPIPFGDGYGMWREEKKKSLEDGREIYDLGCLSRETVTMGGVTRPIGDDFKPERNP